MSRKPPRYYDRPADPPPLFDGVECPPCANCMTPMVIDANESIKARAKSDRGMAFVCPKCGARAGIT